MGYDNEVAKLCRLTNGWEVEIYDPSPQEVKAEDKAAKKGEYVSSIGVYRSPWRTMAFSSFEDAIEFLETKGKDLKPRNFDDEYAASFNATIASMAKKPDEPEKKASGKK